VQRYEIIRKLENLEMRELENWKMRELENGVLARRKALTEGINFAKGASRTGRLISKLENERISKWRGLRRFGRKRRDSKEG